jgi:hypothetical protein
MAWIMRVIYRGYDQDLKELFSQSGVVETAVVISDKFSGQSRGFGASSKWRMRLGPPQQSNRWTALSSRGAIIVVESLCRESLI